jgi:multidrug efflux pump subunit AcrA (membrane-fusion protein)
LKSRKALFKPQLQSGVHKGELSCRLNRRHLRCQYRRLGRDGSEDASEYGVADRSHLAQFPISEQGYLKQRDFFLAQDSRPQFELELILSDATVYPYNAKIDIIGREVESSTGTLRIRGIFRNPGNVLRPGQYSRIRAAASVQQDTLLVPERAVQELQDDSQLAVVGPDHKVSFRA